MSVQTAPIALSASAKPATAPVAVPSSIAPVASAQTGAYTARLHTALEAIAPLWRRFETDGAATAYQRLDWTGRVVDHLAGPMRAAPLVVELVETDTGRQVMLVPLARVRHRGYRVITWLDLGVCDYAAPLLAPGIDLTSEAMADAWSAIRKVLPRADLIRISRIPAEVQGRANPVASLERCRRMEMQASGVAIDGDAATLLDRLCRPSARKDMAKMRRRLDRQGEVTFVKASTAAEVDMIFDALVEQRRSRFSEMGRFDLLSRPDVEAFYRAGAHEGLSGGPARLFGLSVGGTWIAAAYGLVHAGTFHGILLTMAGGAWRNTSPGLHVVADSMTWARAAGLDYFDFTVGVMPYKEDFGVQTRDLDELVEVVTLRGLVVTQALRRSEQTKEWLRTHPEWYAKVQKARRWLRRKAL
ncbi:GNAT family N-acetyltransferase [Methylobacterium sp. BTF04]|uniref:GNAT family N-acetyltransferase n=1 Tax=Methylobacterium sp. BTF04 TaxID=2708300 RepID=UPI0013CF5996|nr:GNAT family N-acetyltransferase [Methylobacterium sp. BTF04]NEU10825.1 GNAT family N-acetyltransferase [Methylobacterium sp. BTF04]